MNPRQRRGFLLLVMAGIGALVVFFSVLSYVASVRRSVPEMVTIYRLADRVPAFEPVVPDVVEEVEIPQQSVPPSAVRNVEQLSGVVAGTSLAAGSILQNDMFVPESGVRRGQREIAILVDAETGVAGRINPNGVVDIYATFDTEQQGQCAGLLIPRAPIVAVGVPRERANPEEGTNLAEEEVLPVTFSLGPRDARKLVYAESFAREVRLALVSPGERTRRRADTACTTPPDVGA